MNQQQKNYTLKRLDEILERKLEPLKEKYTTSEVRLTEEEKWTIVISGQGIVKNDPCFSSYNTYVDDVFDFSDKEKDEFFDKEKYNQETKRLTDACQKLKDEIMLGSAEEAIDKIAEFEAM